MKKHCSITLFFVCTILIIFTRGCVKAEDIDSAQMEDISFEQMVEHANKSAVTIVVRSDEGPDVIMNRNVLGNVRSHGSGVIVTEDGYVVTSYHVVDKYSSESGEKIETFAIIMHDNEVLTARLAGVYERYDLAVLKIQETRDFTFSAIGDSDMLSLGESVITIGTPHGLGFMNTVQKGIISSLDRRGVRLNNGIPGDAMLQIDIPIADGSSGSAVFNMKGQVVGIVRGTLRNERWLATAVISNLVTPMIHKLQIHEELTQDREVYFIEHPCLGVEGRAVSVLIREGQHPSRTGFRIRALKDNSAAYDAGLREDDIITKVDDITLDREDLIFLLAYNGYSAGDIVNVTVYRSLTGEYLEFEVELGSFQ